MASRCTPNQDKPGSDVVRIAVVGYACRFPGDATSPAAFYQMLAEGRDAWSEVPKDRYNIDAYWHPDPNRNGTTVARGAHWLKQDLSVFDAPSCLLPHTTDISSVSMTGAEAGALDPQLRMLLEVTYECLENAGIPMQDAAGSDTSVFVGSSSSEYGTLLMDDIENVPLYTAVGTGVSMLANRISHFYDLRGSSVTLDTACSAGLVATHLGCQSLRTGESRMSFIAGSQLMLTPDGPVALSRLGFLSPGSRCYTFDDRANGYARGEGICVLALKRLDDALADGDNIRAVIRNTLTNQDGRTPGIVQPSSRAQAELIRKTYAAAGLDPHKTQYFEAHGTGTALGDPLEVNALVQSLRTETRPAEDPLYIGSVKTNIGHLEGCAGLAGLLKAILSVEHGVIFPSLNFSRPNPRLTLEEWRLRVPTKLQVWPGTESRQASVNSFGYGGTNAHCIVENWTPQTNANQLSRNPNTAATFHPQLYVWSAPEQAAVSRIITAHAGYIRQQLDHPNTSKINAEDLAYTLALRRSAFQWRICLVADDLADLAAALSKPITPIRARADQSMLFVFTGQGAQHYAMGREMLKHSVIARSIAKADTFLQQTLHADWSVLEELSKSEADSNVHRASYAQPLCTILQVALVDLLRAWKMMPAAVVGHSSGEIAAAYAAHILSAEDAWTIAYHRGRLMDELLVLNPHLGGRMGMLAVGISEPAVQMYIENQDAARPVVVACCNSPDSVTLSGDRYKLEDIAKQLTAEGKFARMLKVDIAYHSPYMHGIADAYLKSIAHIRPSVESVGPVIMVSSVTGQRVGLAELDAAYWVRNMCSPVRFAEAFENISTRHADTENCIELNLQAIVEIGPHSALQGPVRQCLAALGQADGVLYASMLSRGKNALTSSLEVAGSLWSHGHAIDLAVVNQTEANARPCKVLGDLSSYPWNHSNSFWYETAARYRRLRESPRHDLIGVRTDNYTSTSWRNVLRPRENPWANQYGVDDQPQLPPTALLCTAIEAGRQLSDGGRGLEGLTLENVRFSNVLVMPPDGIDILTEVRPVESSSEVSSDLVYDFSIFTAPANRPIYHCQGRLTILPKAPIAHDMVKADLEPREHTQEVHNDSAGRFYSRWAAIGIAWGPQYQLMINIDARQMTASTDLRLKDTKQAMPGNMEYQHIIHPTTLDGCLQALYAAAGPTDQLLRVVSISELSIKSSFPNKPETSLLAEAWLDSTKSGSLTGAVQISDHDCDVLLDVKGVAMQPIRSKKHDKMLAEAALSTKKIASRLYWKPDIDLITTASAQEVFQPETLESSNFIKPQSSDHENNLSLPDRQSRASSSKTGWKALATTLLELHGHIMPTQSILEIATSSSVFTQDALELLGGKYRATPTCTRYDLVCPGPLPFAQQADLDPWSHYFKHHTIDFRHQQDKVSQLAASYDAIMITRPFPGCGEERLLLDSIERLLRPGGWLLLCQIQSSYAKDDKFKQWQDKQGLDLTFARTENSQHGYSSVLLRKRAHTTNLGVEVVHILQPAEPSQDLTTLILAIERRLQALSPKVLRSTLHDTPTSIGHGVISLLEAEDPLIHDLDQQSFETIRTLLTGGSKGGVWVKRGNNYLDNASDPTFSASIGLLRVMRNERPDSVFVELALSSTESLTRDAAVDMVISCFIKRMTSAAQGHDFETEYAEVDGVLHIPRLYDEPSMNRSLHGLVSQPVEAVEKIEAASGNGHGPAKDLTILKCDPEATYLVLGGLGGLGRWLLAKLADHGARHIATFSRSGAASTGAQTTIHDLSARGVIVKAYACDIADHAAFRAAVEDMTATMPPLKGAIHATMVLKDEYFQDMTYSSWTLATRNKIQGALNMQNLLPEELDFFVLVSSISPIMGNEKQANYATGNAFLDGLAHHRRGQGLPACAVNFGLITGVGYVAEHMSFESTHASDYALNSISPEEVWVVMQAAMTGWIDKDTPMPPQMITCAGYGGLYQKMKFIKTQAHTADPKYRYLNVLDAKGGVDSASMLRKGAEQLSVRLQEAGTSAKAFAIFEQAVIEKTAAAIPMSPEDVDASKPLSAYGVDSLVAHEIRSWAINVLKSQMTAVEALSSSSISALSKTLMQRSKLVPEALKAAVA